MSLHGFDGNGQDVRGIGLDRFDGLNNLVARDGLGLDLGLTSDSGISMNVLGLNLAGNDNSEGLTLNDSGTGGDGVDDGDTGGQSDDSVAASAVLAVGDGLGGGEGSGLSSSVCSDGGDRSRSITGDSGTRGGRGVARGSSRSRGITRGSRDNLPEVAGISPAEELEATSSSAFTASNQASSSAMVFKTLSRLA